MLWANLSELTKIADLICMGLRKLPQPWMLRLEGLKESGAVSLEMESRTVGQAESIRTERCQPQGKGAL